MYVLVRHELQINASIRCSARCAARRSVTTVSFCAPICQRALLRRSAKRVRAPTALRCADRGCSSPTAWSKFGALQATEPAVAKKKTRIENDSMGEMEVPADALYAAQTQRAVAELPDLRPADAAAVHSRGLSDQGRGRARERRTRSARAAHRATPSRPRSHEVRSGVHDDQFPIDVFQTGSGTSTNMNANEVLATLASRTADVAGQSERPRQHEPEFERRHPHRDSSVGGAGGRRVAAAGADASAPSASRSKAATVAASRRPAART